MKVSLITTVLNEEKSIESFLDSIVNQTKRPDEVVIVDGGSKDQTIRNIKYQISLRFAAKIKNKNLNIKIIQKNDLNRSQGRNLGIKIAKGDQIAVTDAGCVLDKSWLAEITRPFVDQKVMCVAGFYRPVAETIFQKCLAPYVCVMEGGRDFLPSSRSFAFRKEVWEKVGGYPEELNFCEDLVFDQKIKKAGFNFYFAPKAIVYWQMRKNLPEAFKQLFNYATGDGQVFFSPFQTHSKRIALIFLRYFIFIALVVRNVGVIGGLIIMVFLYLAWAVGKNYRFVKNWRAFYFLPMIQITADIAVILGVINGFLKKGC